MSGLAELIALLDLEAIGSDGFRGGHPKEKTSRVFGGQVVAQALLAAHRTVEARSAHSLHAYFIRPGRSDVPIDYRVDRLRDGKSFSVRRVLAVQDGEAIFSMGCSFHVGEEGVEHQLTMPEVPGPDELVGQAEALKSFRGPVPIILERLLRPERPIEIRPVDLEGMLTRKMNQETRHFWIRTRGALPDDYALHQGVLAYASDLAILDVALHRHGQGLFDGSHQTSSLDHAMWFHRPFRADSWLLYSHDSPSLASSRGFTRGSIFTREGTLVASVCQEGLLRKRLS